MTKTKTYIELNGATYDANTGHIVATTKNQAAKSAKPHGQAIDGVVRRTVPTSQASQLTPQQNHGRVASHKAKAAHRKQQRSATLMRQTVHKPALSDLLFHAKAGALASAGQAPSLNGKATWPVVKPERVQRAQATAKSGLISKFGPSKLLVKMSHLPVVEPSHKQHAAHQPAKTPASHFSKALDAAVSHQQPAIKKPRLNHRVARKLHLSPKLLNISTALLAAVLLGGFFLYQNIPNLTVRLAAARAGFHASLPSYQPAGYSLKGPVHYASGELTINFKSNSDSRNFQVKQQASNWNSETLLQAYVAKQKQPYQTYEDNGRTVYIDNKSANLVTGNKWIQVLSDGSLSTEQLLNIVKSIN